MRQLILAVVSGVSATLAFGAVTNITESVRLDADADWRGQGVAKLGEGVTIDLHGHELKTDGFRSDEAALVDATDNDPAHVVSCTELYSGDATFLFDNDFRYSANANAKDDKSQNHRICATAMPFQVVYDFETPVCINAYKIYYKALGEGNNRAPISWTFEGSADNANWIVLDTHEKDENWKLPDIRYFPFANSTRYRYYRLNVSAHGNSTCLELYQLEYFKAPSSRTDLTYGTNGVSSTSALVAGDAAFLFDDVFKHTYATGDNAKDKSKNHRICAYAKTSSPFEVTYDFGEPTCVNAYEICFNAVGGIVSRAPRDWTFEGSNDTNVEWTVLDSHQFVKDWACPERRVYPFMNCASYRYYRLKITKSSDSGDVLELYQLQYFCRPQIVSLATEEDVTGPEGTVTANKPLYGGSLSDLFDNNFTYGGAGAPQQHRICVNKNYPFDLVYDFGEGKSVAVDAYRIYFDSSSGSTPPQRSPTNWTFEGSNDNSTWTVVDAHTAEPDWDKGTIHNFEFTNAAQYRYYKFSFAKPTSDVLEMYQLEFFDRKGGVVRADVAEGTTVTNLGVTVDGAVRVVKDGAGTVVDNVPEQTFSSGLEVNGGTYEFCREGNWTKGAIELGGGTLALNFVQQNVSLAFPYLTLTADSALTTSEILKMGYDVADSCLDFGGHTLSVSASNEFHVKYATITNGTLSILGASKNSLFFEQGHDLDFTTANFDLNCLYRMYTPAISVHDLTVRATNTVGTAKTMTVYGTFKPVVAGFQDTLLADGATLDLSETAGTLPVKSVWVDKYLSFAEGATIGVKLGDRKPRRGDCLVSWDETHAPQGVTFKIDAASKAYGYDVEARADGLYFLNNRGACILIK